MEMLYASWLKDAAKGINRMVWDLKFFDISPVSDKDKFNPASRSKEQHACACRENILFQWQWLQGTD